MAALRKEKNHIEFLKVFREICDVETNIKWVIVGDGQERSEIEKYIKQKA